MSADKISKPGDATQLVRRLGPFSSYVMCIGSVIGSGIFLVAKDIAASVPTPLGGLLVWVVAGIISISGALIFAELGTMFPKAGGQYVFLSEAFSPIIAFLYGWTLTFAISTGSIAAVAVAFARFSSSFTPMDSLQLNMVATGIILFLTVFNLLGIKRGSQLLDAVTSLKIVAIIGFVITIFVLAPSHSTVHIDWSQGLGHLTPSAFGVGILGAFWAFDGWYALTFVAGEIKDPEKNIPRASFTGLFSVTIMYAVVSYAYLKVLTPEQIAKSENVASDAANVLTGSTGVKIMGALLVLSALGCLNGMILSGARVVYAMAKDRVLPHALAVVNPKTHSPNRALILQMLWSIALVWSGKFDELYNYVIFAGFIFYGLTAYAVLHLRKKRPEVPRPYKVPLYPILPIFYVLVCIGLTANSLMEKPKEALAGLGIIFLGFPAYVLFKKISKAS